MSQSIQGDTASLSVVFKKENVDAIAAFIKLMLNFDVTTESLFSFNAQTVVTV